MTQSRISTRLKYSRLIPQFQSLVIKLLLTTIQEINIPNHPTLRMIQNHHITLILESIASVERTDGSNVTALTAIEFTKL